VGAERVPRLLGRVELIAADGEQALVPPTELAGVHIHSQMPLLNRCEGHSRENTMDRSDDSEEAEEK